MTNIDLNTDIAHLDFNVDVEDVVQAFLAHHGVKGMKWGVHNPKKARFGGKQKLKFGGKKTTHSPSSDHAKVAALRGKPVHALSNQELKDLNARLNLERSFKSLNPGPVAKGEQTAKKMLGTIGLGTLAWKTVNNPAVKGTVAVGAAIAGKKVINAVSGGQMG